MDVWLGIRKAASTGFFFCQLFHTRFVYLFAPAKVYPFVFVPIELHTLFLQITLLHDFDLVDSHLRGKVQVNANNSANKLKKKSKQSSSPFFFECVCMISLYSGKAPAASSGFCRVYLHLSWQKSVKERVKLLKASWSPLTHDLRSVSNHSFQ